MAAAFRVTFSHKDHSAIADRLVSPWVWAQKNLWNVFENILQNIIIRNFFPCVFVQLRKQLIKTWWKFA